MGGKVLLDTNTVIGVFGKNRSAVTAVSSVRGFLPCIALGELYHGAFNSSQQAANLAKLNHFISSVTILGCEKPTSELYGKIKSDLRSIGRPIPENDLWIAAIAIQHGLSLLTNDVHFDHVENLVRISW